MQLFKIFVTAFVVVALISCAWLLIRQDEYILVGLPIFVLLGSILLWVKVSDKTR